MEKIKSKLGAIGITIFELAIGVFLFINPEKLIKFALAGFGVIIFISGLIRLIRYLKARNKEAVVVGSKEDKADKSATPSIFYMVLGIIIFFGYPLLMKIFSAFAIIVGIILIISGILKTLQYNELKKQSSVSSFMGFSALVSIVCGVICIINPFGTMTMLFRFAAVAMIFFAVTDILSMLDGGKNDKSKEKQ